MSYDYRYVCSNRFIILSFFFFFSSRRRHTRLQGDWSSDVCSSDLARPAPAGPASTPRCCPAASAGRFRSRHGSTAAAWAGSGLWKRYSWRDPSHGRDAWTARTLDGEGREKNGVHGFVLLAEIEPTDPCSYAQTGGRDVKNTEQAVRTPLRVAPSRPKPHGRAGAMPTLSE